MWPYPVGLDISTSSVGFVGTPGPAVLPAPSTVGGLTVSSLLATGVPSGSATVTTAFALLQLGAPVNTPAGGYLTLI